MNIDPSEIHDANELVLSLGLSKKEITNSVSADQILTDTWEFAQNIWGNTKVTSFTDHGLQHSLRILSFFSKFSRLFSLDDYSKCVFGIAALIHDIGMQYKYWCTDDLYTLRRDEKAIFPDIHTIDDTYIRQNHCELGFELVYHQISDDKNINYIWNLCRDDNYKDILYQAMYVAFSHSSTSKYFEEMRSKKDTWDSYSDRTTGYSPRLLACILRLCDELDCSISRIKPARLPSSELDDLGLSQWLTCYYISKSSVILPDNLEDHPRIEIEWQAPDKSNQLEKDIIREFLLTNRIIKINSEIEKVINFLRDTKEEGISKLLNLKVTPLSEKPKMSQAISINKEKSSLMLKFTYMGANPANQKEDPFTDDSLPQELIDQKIAIQKDLDEWFFNNIDPKHYVLETSDHTNIFLNCRTLISNQPLLREIGLFITKYFAFKNQKFDCVLAVGTSAIPIAVNVQLFSGCKSTFTMSEYKEASSHNHEEYISSEIIPLMWDSKNILIIDDIISIGDVTTTIINNYLQKKEIENVFHFALFRLGSRQIIQPQKLIHYFWLSHAPWVYYWRKGVDNGECKLCAEELDIVDEHKM